MKDYKVKTKVKVGFNDIQDNKKEYEVNEPITLNRARYEELLSKGFVYEGTKVEEKKQKNEDKD